MTLRSGEHLHFTPPISAPYLIPNGLVGGLAAVCIREFCLFTPERFRLLG